MQDTLRKRNDNIVFSKLLVDRELELVARCQSLVWPRDATADGKIERTVSKGSLPNNSYASLARVRQFDRSCLLAAILGKQRHGASQENQYNVTG